MPLTAKGEKIKRALQSEYGKKHGEQVLYAGENAGTFTGIHDGRYLRISEARDAGKAWRASLHRALDSLLDKHYARR